MPNNFTSPGLQRMSFKDFMNNDNYFSSGAEPEAVESPQDTTLNSLRTTKALANPYSADAKFSLGTEVSPKMDEIPKTIEPSVETPETIGEAPKEGSIFSRILGSLKKPKEKTGVFGDREIIAGMKADEFATLAGSLAHAIAPDTAQGRVGAAVAKLAGSDLEARRKAEAEAPEKDLAKRLTEAKISNLEKSEDPKTAIAWYLKNNPKASPEDVATFKKSLDTDQPGNYWRTTSDDGTVTIYKGGVEIHKSKPGVGQTADKKLYATEESGFQPAEEAIGKTKAKTEKEATPVNWGTASKSLSSRFGKQDATGNFVITRDLQNSHRLAQKKLVELKSAGIDPLDAVNKAEDYARKVEERYWGYIDNAGIDFETQKPTSKEQRESNIKKANAAFKKAYGYVPRIRPAQ